MTDGAGLRLLDGQALPGDALQVLIPVEDRDLSAHVQRNARAFLNAPDKISRHAFGKIIRAHKHVNVPAIRRQKYCGLSG